MAVKKKVRFNIVDFLLIALVLLSVVAIFLRPTVIAQIGKRTSTDTVVVSFVADNVTAEQLDQLKEGDLFYCAGERFGELTAITSLPAETMQLVESENAAGQPYYQSVKLSDRHTVKGQLRLTGSDRENGFYVGANTYVGVGTVLYLESNSCVLTVQITGIS